MIRQQLNLLMDNKVILYGASGHAKVIIDILNENKTAIASIIDDNPKKDKILGIEIKKTIVIRVRVIQ